MAKVRKIIITLALLVCVVIHLYALEGYPNINFFNENEYNNGYDIHNKDNEDKYDASSDYHFDIKNIDNVNYYNSIIDTLKTTSLTHDEELIFQSLTLTFYKMDLQKISSALDLIKNKGYVKSIAFVKCIFKELPDSLNAFKSLKSIKFYECDSLESFGRFNPMIPIFELYFVGCHLKSLPFGIERIHPFLRLLVHLPDDYGDFNLGQEIGKFKERNNVLDLAIRGKNLPGFPENIFSLTSLQTLMFESDIPFKYPAKFDLLNNLSKLTITCWDEEVENSARKNPNFVEFYPLDFHKDNIVFPIYSNLCSISNIYDHYTYWSISGLLYSPKKDSKDIREHKFMFGETEIIGSVVNKEEKMYFYVSNNKNLQNNLKISLLDYYGNQIKEGVSIDGKVVLYLDDVSEHLCQLKITLGRYSKIYSFDNRNY